MDFDHLLVSTKFAPPHIGARYIARQHLLDRLRDARHCSYVQVTGGAGFGKTILLAQWRRELMKAGDEVAWLSLSSDDKQLASFCAYLSAALRRLGIAVDDEGIFEGESAEQVDALVASVINAAAVATKEMFLIVDDYHHVDHPAAHRLMQRLIDHCPANLHIAIAARAAPPLVISRLRVLGRVAEVGFGDLPFDAEESRHFLVENLGSVKLSADELRLIHDMTGGWPASLELMAIMLRRRPETRSTLRQLGRTSGELQAYLAEDVVAHLPAEFHEFLEQVSVCRRFNAELAACVTGAPDAAALIQRAEDENLLVYRVESDDRLPWFRFHPQFGEFLSARLARGGRERVNELHRRAGEWFADHGFLIEAVRHASLGGDQDFAVEAIENAAPDTWSLSYISLLLNLLDRLPQEKLYAHPHLFFQGCLSFAFTARAHKAERWIAQIRASEAAKIPAISSKLPLADAALAMQRDDTERVIQLLEPMRKTVPESGFLRYVYLSLLSVAYASVGRFADAHKLLDQHPAALVDRDSDIAIVAEGTRVMVYLLAGNVTEAARLGGVMLARAEMAHGRRSVCANVTASGLSDAYYELDRLDDAREALANRSGIMHTSMPPVMAPSALCHARLCFMQSGAPAALALLEQNAAHYQGLGLDRLVVAMLGEQLRIRLAGAERAKAVALLAQMEEIAARHQGDEGVVPEASALAAMARARLALAQDDPHAALAALDIAGRYVEAHGRGRLRCQVHLLQALALDALKLDERMNTHLLEALRAGLRFGLVRSFLDEGERVGELLARLGDAVTLDEEQQQLIRDLLGRFGRQPEPARRDSAASSEADAAGAVNLTPRELEILGLVAQAMTNKRIALTLNISLDTVKWNVRNILGKLEMSSRYDAMAWARKRGLLK